MAQRCDVCGRGPVSGRSISHSHIRNHRRFLPNLQRVRHAGPAGETLRLCTRCLRTMRKSGLFASTPTRSRH